MNRGELTELHYIALIANVDSILRRGILSHRRAQRFAPQSIAKAEVQDRRARVTVPGGRPLHEYVNLYVCARDPMLFVRKDRHRTICVLRIATTVLDMPGVIITDQNAASDHARFEPAPNGLDVVDRGLTFAEYWTHREEPIAEWRHKSKKCAEVLVLNVVPAPLVVGAYVSGPAGLAALRALQPPWEPVVDPHLFFL